MVGGTWKKAAKKLRVMAGGTCASFSSTCNANATPPMKKKNAGEAGRGVCAICLDPLNLFNSAIFKAQCSHAFHFSCISSNVAHGSVTCPICRAHWTQLPLPLLHSHHHRPPHHHHHHHRPIFISSSASQSLQSLAAYDVCVRLWATSSHPHWTTNETSHGQAFHRYTHDLSCHKNRASTPFPHSHHLY